MHLIAVCVRKDVCVCVCACVRVGPIPKQIFWDLASLSAYHQDMTSRLDIKEHEVLGKGGFGFVCKGELVSEVRSFC